ncbi:hypothetical protein AB0L40_26975 [Patulibacter sp. NPDC049589]|uniref:WD40 repeat domain-containing protein n=1 Tax=Patulibacter sp. NPDC049589 TaxID=3154731 RepID=UPI00343ADB11
MSHPVPTSCPRASRPRSLRTTLAASAGIVAVAVATVGPVTSATAARRPATVIHGVCQTRNLCTVDPRSGKVTRVLKGTVGAPFQGVTSTVDGRTIAYARGRRIYRANGRAKGAKQVGGGAIPLISPNGRTVAWKTEIQVQQCDAFGVCRQVQTLALFRRSSGEAKPTVVEAFHQSGGWWGTRLITAGSRNHDLELLDGEGDPVRPVVTDPTRAFDGVALDPKGRLLATASEPVEQRPQRFRGRIELFDPATAARVRTLTDGTDDVVGGFSPDGTQVAFNRGKDLWVVPTKGGAARRVAKGFVVTGPSWSRVR